MPCSKSGIQLHRGFRHKVSEAVLSVPLHTPDFCWPCIETVSVFQFCAKLQLGTKPLNKALSSSFHTTALSSMTHVLYVQTVGRQTERAFNYSRIPDDEKI